MKGAMISDTGYSKTALDQMAVIRYTSNRPGKRRRRIRYGRVAVALLLLSLVITVIFAHVLSSADTKVRYYEHRVQAGETLWEIASSLDIRGDIRELVYEIKEVNRLTDSMLYVGQILLLPEH